MKEPTVQLWTRVPITIAAAVQSVCTEKNTNPSEWLRQLIESAVQISHPVAAAAHRHLTAPKRTKRASKAGKAVSK